MPVKKYKPLSPDPYVGKIKGDTEFARLAHLNDLVDQVNNIISTSGSQNYFTSVNLDNGNYTVTTPGVYEVTTTAYQNGIFFPSPSVDIYGLKYTIINASDYPVNVYLSGGLSITSLDANSTSEFINVNGTWRNYYYISNGTLYSPPVFNIYCYANDCTHTLVVSDVTSSTAVFCANFSTELGLSKGNFITEMGFVYGNSPDPTRDDIIVVLYGGLGKREESVGFLSADTTYYVRAYMSYGYGLEGGIAYSENISFTTLP